MKVCASDLFTAAAAVVMTVVAVFPVLAEGTQPALCRLPPETGRCKAAFRRYFYDTTSGKCQEFIYGGCEGNANNFKTLSACNAVCTCTQALSRGNRGCGNRRRRSFYFDTERGVCSRFRYGGCGGNGNRFNNYAQCQNTCAISSCYLPAVTGRCRASFPRFYYDAESRSCRSFVYGGCLGNGNRFRTKEQCDASCTSKISSIEQPESNNNGGAEGPSQDGGSTSGDNNVPDSQKEVVNKDCLLPKVVGRCRAAFPRYYYNQSTGSCDFFIFGGCNGNANNFKTLQECQLKCGLSKPSSNLLTLSETLAG